MYYIKIDEADNNKLAHYCRNCGHNDQTITDRSICILNTQVSNERSLANNTNTLINKYTKLDPTLPRIYTIPCPNAECKTNTGGANRDVLYLRYDDDKLLYLYMCCVCDTKWKS
jgi:DNA-directed RNA polymerase subunit M/transcription elongation factor TFIIS